MDFGFDSDLLRHDLLDYYGTAAFNGFPVAMMDVFAVERMSDDELWSQAQRNGFLMDKYTSHQTVSSLNLQSILNYSYASSPASFVPVSNSRNSSKKEDITFPTYETAVPNSFFQMSPESREIISVRPNQWGYKLLAQELKNYAYQLSRLKKQTSDNPYVKRIGHDSEGRPLLYYIVGFSENLENGIKKFPELFLLLEKLLILILVFENNLFFIELNIFNLELLFSFKGSNCENLGVVVNELLLQFEYLFGVIFKNLLDIFFLIN